MAHFFASSDAFWNEFIVYFIVLSGALAFIEFRFLFRFLGLKIHIFKAFLVFLALYYVISAVCIEWSISELAERFVYFAFLSLFAYFLGKAQKQKSLYVSLTGGLLIVTVLTLCDGIIAPVVHLLPSFGVFDNRTIFIISDILLTALTLLLPYFVLRAIGHYLRIEQESKLPFLFILFVPLTLLILFSQTIFDVGYKSEMEIIDKRAVSVFNNYQILLVFCFSFLCLFVILFSYKKVLAQLAEQKHKTLLESQLSAQQIYTKEASIRYEMTRSFRHDLNNHFIVLRQLLESNQSAKAEAYLQEFSNAADNLSYQIQTGNAPLDALLADKLALAKQGGISITLNVDIPKDLKINDFDLCALFFNALDNAITACGGIINSDKWIDIKARRNRDFFLIDIMNSYDKNARSKKGSGIGLQTIKLISDKYGGTMNIDKGNDTFILTILLSL